MRNVAILIVSLALFSCDRLSTNNASTSGQNTIFQTGDAAIYQALQVNSFSVNNSTLRKQVGNLYCDQVWMSTSQGVTTQTGCQLVGQSSSYDAQSIYQVLNVGEFDVNGGLIGGTHVRKSAGRLSCDKSGAVVPNPIYTYSCQFN